MNTEELVKQLKLEKDCDYLIFVSKESGLCPDDLQKVNLGDMGKGTTQFVMVKGNVAELIKVHKVK